jgi:hypothetical protein
LSRGSSPSGYPAEPLVSYQINRQLSGWNLPPQVIRAFGAHCHNPTSLLGPLSILDDAVCFRAIPQTAIAYDAYGQCLVEAVAARVALRFD